MCRRCGERDRRGNAADRRARKRWLLAEFGDGTTCPCTWCNTTLDWTTVQQDRIVPGGPYRRDNLVPACADCNLTRVAASIPDGCHYGPVGDLATDRHGHHLDEQPATAADIPAARSTATTDGCRPTRTRVQHTSADRGVPSPTEAATSTIPRPRAASTKQRPGDAAVAANHEGPITVRFPRPHRTAHRVTPPPGHQPQPAALRALALAEHTRDDHQVEPTGEIGDESDLVVIDTTDADELRAQHPWLFGEPTSSAEGETDAAAAQLRRIDADLVAAETALNRTDEADDSDAANGNVHRDRLDEHQDDDGRDAGWGR